MKWIFSLIALLSLVLAYLYFFAGPATVAEVDPNQPWTAKKLTEVAPDPESLEVKADPRKIEDIVLQKDYCGAGQFFSGGKNRHQLGKFLELMLEGEEGKQVPHDDRLILEGLLARDLHTALKKLKEAKSWQGKMIYGMMLSGAINHPWSSIPRTKDQLQEALVAFDEAEDLNWDNGWIPVYRYIAMGLKDGKGPGLEEFLRQEISRRKKMESPFDGPKISFGRLRSQNPLYFAASLPIGGYGYLHDVGNVNDGESAVSASALASLETAKAGLPMVDAWHKSRIGLVNEGFSEPVVSLHDVASATDFGATLWKKANPGQPLPDRYRESPSNVVASMQDRNPSETDAFGWKDGYAKECGPKWKEAVDNDTNLLRDRLRKWDERVRSGRL